MIHVVGGGSQSAYLCQRVATICKREVVAGPVEGAALGNVLIQGLALGKIRDLAEGRSLVKQLGQVTHYTPGTLTRGLEERYRKYLTLKST